MILVLLLIKSYIWGIETPLGEKVPQLRCFLEIMPLPLHCSQALPLASTGRRRFHALLAGVALAAWSTGAVAQTVWPSKPVRFVVGFAAGGPTDAFARILAKRLGDQLGQPVIVDNRPGANANIAAEAVARSAPDGYTFLYNSSSLTISPAVYRELPFDVRKDFTAVGLVMAVPAIIVMNPSVPVETAAELVAYMKAHPDALSYASGGVGNLGHLGMEMFFRGAGVEAKHVPYKGNSAAYPDLLAGRVHFLIETAGAAMPNLREKKLRALVTLGSQRVSALPDVPTARESGIPIELETWQGIMAPAKTPAEIVRRMNAEIAAAMASDEIRSALAGQYGRSLAGSPQQYESYLLAEMAKYAQIAKVLNVTLD
jgi:tripartite-type tricarboxylate transporter receptor subunit TctC